MTTSLALILFIIFVALAFDFLNGFHDAANAIATIVSTRVLSPLSAVIMAAVFNFVAAFVFGTGVAKTIGKGMIDVTLVDEHVILAGLTGAIVWNIITWLTALPTSSSHALIGGYAGAAIAKAGFGAIIPMGWVPVLCFMIMSPIIGFALGRFNMVAVYWICRKTSPRRVDKLFRRLQLVSAALFSLGHGTNDAQKTMGIIVALLLAAGKPDWTEGNFHMFGRQHEMALWIILSCHAAIALGTLSGGWRIVKTMGQRITRLQPVGGFCAETAGAITSIGTAIGGIPISTTHAITGAILGVGTTQRKHAVRWIWGRRIVVAWILTLPCAAAMAAVTYFVIEWVLVPMFK
jgi:PiT family inorganic phosphate transporter